MKEMEFSGNGAIFINQDIFLMYSNFCLSCYHIETGTPLSLLFLEHANTYSYMGDVCSFIETFIFLLFHYFLHNFILSFIRLIIISSKKSNLYEM